MSSRVYDRSEKTIREQEKSGASLRFRGRRSGTIQGTFTLRPEIAEMLPLRGEGGILKNVNKSRLVNNALAEYFERHYPKEWNEMLRIYGLYSCLDTQKNGH